MFGSSILDVAIGVIFVFLLVSLIVTAVTELISGWLKWRAKNLWMGVQNLLGSAEFAKALYQHPLIQAGSPIRRKGSSPQSPSGPGAKIWFEVKRFLALIIRPIRPKAAGPSYIKPRTFAIALVDLTKPADFARVLTETKNALQVSIAAIPANATDQDVRNAVAQAVRTVLAGANIPPLVKQALEQWIATVSNNLTAAEVRLAVQDFMDGTNALWNTQWARAVLTLFEESAHDLEKLKQNVETWFDDAMDRVGGWYKRKTQLVHVLLAVGFAVALNVDAMLIAKSLLRDPALRQSIVAQAEKFAQQPPVAITVPPAGVQTNAAGQSGATSNQPASTAAPPSPGFALKPSTVTAGVPAFGTITLIKAEDSDIDVSFTSTNRDVAAAPEGVKIEKGKTSQSFEIKTQSVASDTAVKISASYAGQSADAVLNVTESPREKYRLLKTQLDQLALPIGWTSPGDAGKDNSEFREWVGWPRSSWSKEQYKSWIDKWRITIRFHFLGWLVTAVAASLGAPFWFDMLNKVISIRSAGRSPEENEKAKKKPG